MCVYVCVQLLPTPWTVAHQAPLFSIISRCLLKFMSVDSVVLLISNHLLYHPFPLLPSVLPELRSFQWVGFSHQVAKVLQLQQQSFQWIQDWFPLGLTGLISLHGRRIPRYSQESSLAPKSKRIKKALSLFYGSTLTTKHDCWKTNKQTNTALPTQMFVFKVISLLFNTLSRFVITFLPRAWIF